jgi:hypothetical protein
VLTSKTFLRIHQSLSYFKFHSILWNLRVHYGLHKSPPFVPVLIQINTVHTTPIYFSHMHFNTILPPTFRFCWWSHPSSLRTKILYVFIFSPMRATWLTHFFLDLILIIFGKEYKLWSSSFCNFSILLFFNLSRVEILSLMPCLQTLNLCSSCIFRDQVSHPYKTRGKIILSYFSFYALR